MASDNGIGHLPETDAGKRSKRGSWKLSNFLEFKVPGRSERQSEMSQSLEPAPLRTIPDRSGLNGNGQRTVIGRQPFSHPPSSSLPLAVFESVSLTLSSSRFSVCRLRLSSSVVFGSPTPSSSRPSLRCLQDPHSAVFKYPTPSSSNLPFRGLQILPPGHLRVSPTRCLESPTPSSSSLPLRRLQISHLV